MNGLFCRQVNVAYRTLRHLRSSDVIPGTYIVSIFNNFNRHNMCLIIMDSTWSPEKIALDCAVAQMVSARMGSDISAIAGLTQGARTARGNDAEPTACKLQSVVLCHLRERMGPLLAPYASKKHRRPLQAISRDYNYTTHGSWSK